LASLIARHGVSSIVVGLPLNMDGSRGEMAREVETFADRIRQETGLPVDSFDERLTSSEAERVLLEAGLPRRRRKNQRDSLAAVLILQGYLDQRNRSDRSLGPTSGPTPSSPLS
jgi:putative Holliday junction resolvase